MCLELRRLGAVLLVVPMLTIASCGSAPTRNTQGGVLPGMSLSQAPSVLIVAVPDAQHPKDGPVHGSGNVVTVAIRDSLLAHKMKTTVSEATGRDSALKEAASSSYSYIIVGNILKWDDHNYGWSGIPDAAQLSLDLYDVSSRDLVANAKHFIESGDSNDAGGSKPDRLVPELVDSALARIFGWKPTVFAEK